MSFGANQSPKTNAEYIRNLIANGHESVLEHANWTFVLSGISRAFTHQLVRHRVGFAFSQLSQQYHNESESRFVIPHGIEDRPKAEAAWQCGMQQAKASYEEILAELSHDAEVTKPTMAETKRALLSAARSVLPNATETAIVVTANARAIRHFLRIRGGIVGDLEMRSVASILLEKIRPEGPALFADLSVEIYSDQLPIVVMNEVSRERESHQEGPRSSANRSEQ
jgi:thymidylate synthase (FAD)